MSLPKLPAGHLVKLKSSFGEDINIYIESDTEGNNWDVVVAD